MENLKIVPYPQAVELSEGTASLSKLKLVGEEHSAADFFKKYSSASGFEICDGGTPVNYAIDNSLDTPEEGYKLIVGKDSVNIVAKDDKGLVHALVSLMQLISNYGGPVPCAEVVDYPTVKYRGFLFDVCRYFYTAEEVKLVADICAMHKLNVLHLHITDDHGWRLPIDKYPLLTEIGSMRSRTCWKHKPHGGYYTKAEIADIIAYCNSIGIEVVPEVDLPGHTMSVLAAYPELGCFGRKVEVSTNPGVKHDILCAGKDKVYRFVFDVLDETFEMFGKNTKFIHIGGDEVFKHRWNLCPDCQQKMKDEGLATLEDLQRYFMIRISDYVIEKGYTPIIWDEGMSRVNNEKIIYEYWANPAWNKNVLFEDAYKATGSVINATSANCYLDMPHSYINLKKAYQFSPLAPDCKFSGAEMCLWTEDVPHFNAVCRRIIPRAGALSEAMWSSKDKDYREFKKRSIPMTKWLESCGFKGVPYRAANPLPLRSLLQTIYFERRQLFWEGAKNIREDKLVEKQYGPKKDKK